jgi:hypothetical protein
MSEPKKYPRVIAHVSAKAGDPDGPVRRMTFAEAVAECERDQQRMFEEAFAQLDAHYEREQGATVFQRFRAPDVRGDRVPKARGCSVRVRIMRAGGAWGAGHAPPRGRHHLCGRDSLPARALEPHLACPGSLDLKARRVASDAR